MPYRVCIPTAGTGSRLGQLTKFLNKSLVSVANRPALSHLIEQFPADAEFVLALGHKGLLIRQFLKLAYPTRSFLFSDVEPFEGPGSGLGLSLLACMKHLQEPFVFVSCDTLVRGVIPAPSENWIGFSNEGDLAPYRSLEIESSRVVAICEKGEGNARSHKAYIGLAGIHDYEEFWRGMFDGGARAVDSGECHGLRNLLPLGVRADEFTWYDTGNPESLERTRHAYSEPCMPNILEKPNEAIWFVEDQVIKFSDDDEFIRNRVARARTLRGFVPEINGVESHMYRYGKVEGRVLSDVVTLPLFDLLLTHCKGFWVPSALEREAASNFRKACMRFYHDKTRERIDLFYSVCQRKDGREAINGFPMPTLDSLLKRLDWAWLSEGLPGRFHGDFHFENILWSAKSQCFTFIDWRQDFAGSLTTGDIYYDLAKLLHGLIISHELIVQGQFWIAWDEAEIAYDFHRKQKLVECEHRLGEWIEMEGYDRRKVWTLTALVFLNIAALHHDPYRLLLYALGKSILEKELR